MNFDDRAGLHFGQTSYAVQAAIDGLGVALGDSNLVADDLAAGRLVKPFELVAAGTQILRLLPDHPAWTPSDAPLVEAFRNWCMAGGEADGKPPRRQYRRNRQSLKLTLITLGPAPDGNQTRRLASARNRSQPPSSSVRRR